MNMINQVIEKDVIIAGGGMAGVSAAISAAESGANVLVVEQSTYLGGTATGAMVTPLMTGGIYTQDGKKVISGNLDRIFECIQKYEDASGYNFNPEILKHVLDKMLAERNVDILFKTFIYDVEKWNNRINGITAVNKSGVAKFSAKVFIDTTGDADVAYKAGVPCKIGRAEDGLTQAATLRFALGNVNVDKAVVYMNSEEGSERFRQAISEYSNKTGFEILDSHGFQNFTINGRLGELVFNCPRITGVDATDSKSLTGAYIQGREKVMVYYKLLKENVPGCEDAFISHIAELLGIRESRRIVGEYVLSSEDVVKGKKFSDSIACNCWYIDIHNPKGHGILGINGTKSSPQYPEGGWNDIPYKSLYSNSVKNLLTAGRCISATHEALAAVRIMASCIAMGQAAGTAAGLMVKNSQDVGDIDVQLLRRKLVEDGAAVTGINL